VKRCAFCNREAALILRWKPVSMAFIEDLLDTLSFPFMASRLPDWAKFFMGMLFSLPFEPMRLISRRREIPICERCRLSLPIRVCRWWRADLSL